MAVYHYDTILANALRTEWDFALERLPQEMRGRLRAPLFEIRDEMRPWGMWQGGLKRVISLKRDLIARHPWYAVRDVLRHEMAHQLKAELHPEIQEADHGPCFRRMCHLLGARPEASGDFPLIDQLVYADGDLSDDAAEAEGARSGEARLMVRLRKLLSLSGSTNPHEAESALLKARELAAKYALDLEEARKDGVPTPEDERHYTVSIGECHPRLSLEEAALANLLQDFFGVMAVREYAPDLETGRPSHILTLSGTRRSLQLATYVHDCIQTAFRRAQYDLPPLMLARTIASKRALKDFRLGLLEGFRAKLREQNQRPEMRALVLADKTRLKEYLAWQYPHLRTHSAGRSQIDGELRAAGNRAGRRLDIRPALQKANSGRKRLNG